MAKNPCTGEIEENIRDMTHRHVMKCLGLSGDEAFELTKKFIRKLIKVVDNERVRGYRNGLNDGMNGR